MENNVKEVYTDGIGKIHFFGGMIRMDLFSFQPTENESEKPTPNIKERLIMSPNAFLASYESFLNMIDRLKEAGIISNSTETANSAETEQEETK